MTAAATEGTSLKPAPEPCERCGNITGSAPTGGVWACEVCRYPRTRMMPAREMPETFAGALGVEWPAGDLAAGEALPGWKICFYDAEGPVPTVTEFTLHASAEGIIWADLTMYADEDGKPVLHPCEVGPLLRISGREPLHWKDGKIVTGTFPYLITSMRVR